MKYPELKKRVIKEGIIVAAVLGAFSVGVFLLGMLADSYHTSNSKLKKQVDTINNDMNTLKTKYMNIKQDVGLYEYVKKRQAEGNLAINRKAVMAAFDQFKNDYVLDSMHLSMSPIVDVADAKYKRKNSKVTVSDVSVGLNALSDEYVYALLSAMQRDMAGTSKITKLTMSRDIALTDDVLHTISTTGAAPLVRSEIKFQWFGINSIEADDTADATKKK